MSQMLVNATRSGLLLLLAIAGLVVARYWGHYLLFHVLVELFSAVVLSSVFVVTWNTRQRQTNGYLTLLGLASVFVAALGIVHTMAYDGMRIIPGVEGPNQATQIWIVMGVIKSVTLVVAPLFVNRKINSTAAISIYTAAFTLAILTILEWPLFPDCFRVGEGLTPFKVYTEYVICGLFMVAAIEWWAIRRQFSEHIRYLLLASLLATVSSEWLFTMYTRVDAPWNMIGHILNMIAYYLLYKAIVQAALTDPFSILLRDLKLREQELEKHNAELDLARRAAEEASRAKGQFLAVLSHELRTPLTPVLASVSELLVDSRVPSHLRETLQMVQRNVELQARLVDDLLDVTRIDRGKIHLNRQQVDVHSSIMNAAEICRPDYVRKGVQLSLAFDAKASWANGDSARLEQIIWNLLTNARKFTPSNGSVIVRTQNEPGRDGAPLLSIEVVDTGIGIEPAAQRKLFTPFEQVGEEATRAGGLGLGLAITRAMVALHGGSISVHSDGHDKGSTFTVKLPTITAPVARIEPAAPGPIAETRARRILLVEDHSDTARVVAQLLRRDGHHVEIAGDLASARRIFAADHCNLVISDIGLPDGSGIDLLREFRTGRPDVPAICMSGYGAEADLRASAEAGTICHLIKPITVQRLRDAIRDASMHSPVR